jgi:hypothetical protein
MDALDRFRAHVALEAARYPSITRVALTPVGRNIVEGQPYDSIYFAVQCEHRVVWQNTFPWDGSATHLEELLPEVLAWLPAVVAELDLRDKKGRTTFDLLDPRFRYDTPDRKSVV